MISLAHHPIVQDTIDRWRLELPVVPQLDESAITKEHLRLLIQRLISAIESLVQPDNQPSTDNGEQSTAPSSVLRLRSASQPQPLP